MPDRLLTALDRAWSLLREGVDNEGIAWLVSEPAAKLAALRGRGAAPRLPDAPALSTRPITVISVRLDESGRRNLVESPAFSDPALSLAIVDDPFGLRFGSAARALSAGLSECAPRLAPSAVVAFALEECWLPEGWGGAVDAALLALEQHDPEWRLAGLSGADDRGQRVGHVSEPWGLLCTFTADRRWTEVASLDAAVLLVPTARRTPLDVGLPGFEGLGLSLSRSVRRDGGRAYAIDAPATIERVDGDGTPVVRPFDSRRIRGQLYRQQRVQRAMTLEYVAGAASVSAPHTIVAPFRWPGSPAPLPVARRRAQAGDALDEPIVILGKGGGGSRLASLLVADCGVSIGRVNVSGDCLDMVGSIYAGVLRVHDIAADWQRARVVPDLRAAAETMLATRWRRGEPWGFKVPEALLLLPQLAEAFPRARFLLLARHPVSTCLRRTHMTAEPDNPIGRVALSAAYRFAGLPPEAALNEAVELRSARVTLHQVGGGVDWLRDHIGPDRRMEIHFEDLVETPDAARDRVAAWLGLRVVGHRLNREVDGTRASYQSRVAPDVVDAVERLLGPLARSLGYGPGVARDPR